MLARQQPQEFFAMGRNSNAVVPGRQTAAKVPQKKWWGRGSEPETDVIKPLVLAFQDVVTSAPIVDFSIQETFLRRSRNGPKIEIDDAVHMCFFEPNSETDLMMLAPSRMPSTEFGIWTIEDDPKVEGHSDPTLGMRIDESYEKLGGETYDRLTALPHLWNLIKRTPVVGQVPLLSSTALVNNLDARPEQTLYIPRADGEFAPYAPPPVALHGFFARDLEQKVRLLMLVNSIHSWHMYMFPLSTQKALPKGTRLIAPFVPEEVKADGPVIDLAPQPPTQSAE